MRKAALSIMIVLAAQLSAADEVGMVRLAGTPEQIGTAWGEMNKEVIRGDFETAYLKQAESKGISEQTLLQRSAAAVRIIEKIAPHWVAETRAVARAAGVPEDLYLAYYDAIVRSRFLHRDPEECTSYAVGTDYTADGVILFHKNRDNRDSPQAAYMVESSLEGINKFIAISNATGIHGFSMMVNEKGLAGSGDYPANRKKDSSELELPSAPDQYRGIMGATILRHIAERASTCAEALAIIEDCVKKHWYAGGDVGGNHWLFVDREGTILEVCNNSRHVVSKVHTKKAYFSRLNKSSAARRLRDATEPVDFRQFHKVSRDPSICLKSSIAGMTVEIDPDRPELFTCAWIALPARSVAFPLLMGQTSTPACLLDGQAYALGKRTKGEEPLWGATERFMHADKEELRCKLTSGSPSLSPEQVAGPLDRWSRRQATMLLDLLKDLHR